MYVYIDHSTIIQIKALKRAGNFGEPYVNITAIRTTFLNDFKSHLQ